MSFFHLAALALAFAAGGYLTPKAKALLAKLTAKS